MKFYHIIILTLLALGLAACVGNSGGSGGSNAFGISGNLNGCADDSMKVFVLDGFVLNSIAAAPITKEGGKSTFSFDGKLPAHGFYWVGTQPQNAKSLILAGETGLTLGGDCSNLSRGATLTGSKVNDVMAVMSQRMGAMQNEISQVSQVLNSTPPGSRPDLTKKANDIYAKQVAMIDSLKKTQPLLAKVFVLNLYEPFDANNNPGNYPNSLEHFAGEYFSKADLSDPSYNYLPILSDYARGFAQNVFRGQLTQQKAEMYWNKFLDRLPAGSLARKNVMVKSLMVLEQLKSPSYATYSNKYLSENPNDPNAQALRQVAGQIKAAAERQKQVDAQFAVGSTPPNISMPDPDGKTIQLTDLKGKVVMIDFWASWCRPCRMENPNVVKLYNQYKNQGFEVLGVSLDKTKPKWVQAIAADNLTWLHVSDLKAWRNKAAQDYKVNSIPATFLLDREGKVLAKGLRGKALENKLAEIFASN